MSRGRIRHRTHNYGGTETQLIAGHMSFLVGEPGAEVYLDGWPITIGSSILGGFEEWCGDQVNPRPYIGGGNLLLQRTGSVASPSALHAWAYLPGSKAEYKGRIFADMSNVALASTLSLGKPDDSFGDTSGMYATGWNRYRPGKPTAGLGVALGELRDMPKTIGRLKEGIKPLISAFKNPQKLARQGGKDFLEYQMAWAPLVSDVRKVINTYHNADKTIDKLYATNGKWHKRGGELIADSDQIASEDGESLSVIAPLIGYPILNKPHRYHASMKMVQNVWFDAKMRYWMPDVRVPANRKRLHRKLYGLSITPSLVWELTPWSWLVDYFTNVGDVVDNLSNDGVVDDLVASYAFVMGHTRQEISMTVSSTWNCPAHWLSPGNTLETTCGGVRYVEVKRRDTGSPFGPSLAGGDLTLRQTAILAALGITRL